MKKKYIFFQYKLNGKIICDFISCNNVTKFWVTLKYDDFVKLAILAKELNLSISAYVGQILSDYMHTGDKQVECESTHVAWTPTALNEKVMEALNNKASGDEFTIRELFLEDEWMEIFDSNEVNGRKTIQTRSIRCGWDISRTSEAARQGQNFGKIFPLKLSITNLITCIVRQ